MPTKDPIKNLEYVKKSQQKTKDAIGIEAFREMHSSVQAKYRNNLKANGLEEYKKQQAEYMKEYRAKQKALKEAAMKKEKAISVLTNAIRFRKAKQEMNVLKENKANEVKRRPGRPRKPRNPVGRPKGSKNKPKVAPTMALRPRKS